MKVTPMCHGPKYLNLLCIISFHGNISPFNCPYSFLPPHALFLKQPKGKILKPMSSQKNTASFSSFCNDVAMNLIWPILATRPKEVCMNKFSPVIFQSLAAYVFDLNNLNMSFLRLWRWTEWFGYRFLFNFLFSVHKAQCLWLTDKQAVWKLH